MKIAHFVLLLIISIVTFSCNQIAPTTSISEHRSPLDSLLQTIESDQYGMQKYIIAYLKKGPNRDRPKEEADALQKAHMENIDRMAAEGKLVLAGPFLDDGDIRGLYIFNVPTVEEARALTASDPAIQAGSLEMELVPWYGSAAVQGINYLHGRLQTKSIPEE